MIKKDICIIAVLMTVQIERVAAIFYFITFIIIYNLVLKIMK